MAHSVFPHHHRIASDMKAQDKHHHHHSPTDTHHHGESDDESRDLVNFGKLDHTFLAGKQLVVPVGIAPVIEVYNWSVIITNVERKADNFYIEDIELPPWIRCQEISFRGPPSF
jgi:hypothetical protein